MEKLSNEIGHTKAVPCSVKGGLRTWWSLVAEVWWRNRSWKKLRCKSKNSEGKMLYHFT